MFCPNCGTFLPDGSAFCANCGSALGQSQPAAPVYAEPAAPVYAEPAAPTYADPYNNPYAAPVMAKNQKVWLSTLASPKAKKMANLVPIFTIACVLVLILAIFTAYLGPFYNIPVFKMAFGEAVVSEFKDIQQEALDADEELHDLMYSMGVGLSDIYDDDKIEDVYDACMALVKNPSFGNMRKLMVVCGEEEAAAGYTVILVFLFIAFGFVALLAVLGGLLKKSGLVIAAMVFSIPVNLLFGGVIFLILTLAAMGILTWTLMQISKEYKAYKKAPGNTYAY